MVSAVAGVPSAGLSQHICAGGRSWKKAEGPVLRGAEASIHLRMEPRNCRQATWLWGRAVPRLK